MSWLRNIGVRVGLGIFLLDQVTKVLIVHVMDLKTKGAIDVFPPYLNFRMAWNEGINFGLLSRVFVPDMGPGPEIMRWTLIGIALMISAWVIWWVQRDLKTIRMLISAGLLVGGALGNVVDRVIYGAVADFLNMSCCGFDNPYAFNVADISIFAGAIGLIAFSDQKKETP